MRDYHTMQRLYSQKRIQMGTNIPISKEQHHYIVNVLRLASGGNIRLFNELDGEFLATLEIEGKKNASLHITEFLRNATSVRDLWLCCAPIRRAHFDDIVMKATELGVSRIQPILTGRTQVRDINQARLRSIAIEAAEQSERFSIPEIGDPIRLEKLVKEWKTERTPLICAEFGTALPVGQVLAAPKTQESLKTALFTGPEGGFMPEELELLQSMPNSVSLRLGPRILRADTAALAALSCWQALCGDWKMTENL